jgi:lipopolysaccharide/colanic/teichoic acid biosynthesis glycosyltransferase
MHDDATPGATGPVRSTDHRAALTTKRLVDLVGGTLALLLTLPVIALAAVLVLICDGRPILFRQERLGRRGEPFTILKFRTMVGGAERMLARLEDRNERHGPLFKMAHDPRVTRVGRFLRDSSIDELPQLLNVLRGDMSLVGPRPALARESATFGTEHVQARQRVRPGITGLWQITARDEAGFEEYERLDMEYVETRTLWLDIRILLLTIPAVLVGGLHRIATHSRPVPDVAPSGPWHATAWYGKDLLEAQPRPAIAGNQRDR